MQSPWPLPCSFCVSAVRPSPAVHLRPKNIPIFHSRCQNLALFRPAFFLRRSLTVAASARIRRDCHTRWIRSTVVVLVFASCFAVLRSLLSVVPPDFRRRWNALVREEECCVGARAIPPHVWQAVVASEDRRFFRHSGIDPRGIARAALSLTAKGGGSTITQQLVKNLLLTNERKWARKVLEAILALCIERQMSKWNILWIYLRKIYWGHGVYGIDSASDFYFGKHPSLLNLGESALLAGIVPSPEVRSPFKDPSRGKKYQARVLRKMVEAGYLNIETALWVLSQPIYFSKDGVEASRTHRTVGLIKEEAVYSTNTVNDHPIWKDVWDWERESSSWEIRENMETWARKHREQMIRISIVRNKLEYLLKLLNKLL